MNRAVAEADFGFCLEDSESEVGCQYTPLGVVGVAIFDEASFGQGSVLIDASELFGAAHGMEDCYGVIVVA